MTHFFTDEPVEQIFFGFSGGLVPIRWSSGLSDSRLDRWAERLDKYVRLSPTTIDRRPWVPDRAFSYFEFSDQTAAVLARFNTGESGRNNAHALVGSKSALGAYAMYLSNWDDWCPTRPLSALSSISLGDLQQLAPEWTAEVWESSGTYRSPLIALVREVLHSNATHFTVVVPGQSEPLRLLTLARAVLDPVLSTPDYGEDFGWTYSTYEKSDTDREASPDEDGAPKFWCVRSLPDSGHTGRFRVDATRTPAGDRHGELATKLVASCLDDSTGYAMAIQNRLAGGVGHMSRRAMLLEDYQGKQPAIRQTWQSAPPSAPTTTIPRVTQHNVIEERQVVSVPDAVESGTSAPAAPAPPASAPQTGVVGTKRRNRLPDAHKFFDKLASDLPRQKQVMVERLRELWEKEEDPFYASFRRLENRMERRLMWHDWVLAGALAVLAVVIVLAWPTPQRDPTVPPAQVVTVTYTPPPTATTPSAVPTLTQAPAQTPGPGATAPSR